MARKAWPNLEQFLFYKCIDKKVILKYVQGDELTSKKEFYIQLTMGWPDCVRFFSLNKSGYRSL